VWATVFCGRAQCRGNECYKIEFEKSQGLRCESMPCGSDRMLSGGQENSMETKFRIY
jgi:hypothetical protein